MNRKKWIYGTLIIWSFLIMLMVTATAWFNSIFGVSIVEILYTLSSPLKGSDTSFIKASIPYITVGIIIWAVLLVAYIIFDRKIVFKLKKDEYIVTHIFIIMFMVSITCISWFYINNSLAISDYVKERMNETTLYQDYYVDPKNVTITGENTKNIIYIYMESMETTYSSYEVGGNQDTNYIPRLTNMAMENISFSDSDMLGGWQATTGTTWTMGALFSTQSGIPFSFPIEGNSMDTKENFASGVVTMGDILEDYGYYNEFLCGSEAEFAGRADFFQQHGNFQIADYNWAVAADYIDEGRFVFWGYEDFVLYRIAKDRLTYLGSQNQPFNYVMLTVDTHHAHGYLCPYCGDTYDEQLANVLECADTQIYDFIEWCKLQSWYENTVIVITGDHPRMDSDLVENVPFEERTVYNCFFNVNEEIYAKANTENREFTAMDMFPTVLVAAGFDIEGDKLGLGTNLFSDTPTLCEELGMEFVDSETAKYSNYYVEKFE